MPVEEQVIGEATIRDWMYRCIELESEAGDAGLLGYSTAFLEAMNRPEVTFVGNGPSLTMEQLENISGPSIACNRINLIYDKTDWRPTYYVYTDRYANPNWGEELIEHLMQGYPCFVRADIAYAIPRWWAYGNLRLIAECHLRPVGNNLPPEVTEPWEAGHPWHHSQMGSICTYGGALNTSAQLAWQLGFKTFKMIGCDGVYVPHGDNHSAILPNYADPSGGELYDERMTGYINHRQDYVHALIRKELPKRGMELIDYGQEENEEDQED